MDAAKGPKTPAEMAESLYKTAEAAEGDGAVVGGSAGVVKAAGAGRKYHYLFVTSFQMDSLIAAHYDLTKRIILNPPHIACFVKAIPFTFKLRIPVGNDITQRTVRVVAVSYPAFTEHDENRDAQ